MPKGFFSQGVAILLEQSVELAELLPLLGEFGAISRRSGSGSWELGGDSLVFYFRDEVNGVVVVDVVPKPWPDNMGNPQTEAGLFGAWSMGNFGPFTYPGNLERAMQQCWSWPDAKVRAGHHQAFIRIRTSYVLGAEPQTECLPPDYDARDEAVFLMRVVGALSRHPKAVCYFNPNGEILLDQINLENSVRKARVGNFVPLDALANVRMFSLDEQWLLMDTVGMAQVDLIDVEAYFPKRAYAPNDVASFLRNLSLYLLENGLVIEDGHTVEGPGNVSWRATYHDSQMLCPPRPVLRLTPADDGGPETASLE
jgi:hypothetical protein